MQNKRKKVIDYKKELESASKNMILVHNPALLIKMVVRTIVQKVKVKHAGILLHQKDKDTYILTISRGAKGLKIPAGFARIDSDNPLIQFFRKRINKEIGLGGAVTDGEAQKILKRKNISEAAKLCLKGVLYQMKIFVATVCIPSYYRDELLGVFLFGKKNRGEKFTTEELDFLVALSYDVAMAIRNAQLFQELEAELDKNKRLFLHTTVALAAAIDAKDRYTFGHTERVTNLGLEIAKKLMQKNRRKFDEKFLEHLRISCHLHDIGKIGIPESILNKEGPLDEEEKKRMQEHPLVGVGILQPIRELGDAILGVKYHHERFDGSGYPEGLQGNQIPLIASIISVADCFDAMTTNRPYRRAFTKEEAVREIEKNSGTQFDPFLTQALVELYKEGKI